MMCSEPSRKRHRTSALKSDCQVQELGDQDEEERSSINAGGAWLPVLPPQLFEILNCLNDSDRQNLLQFYSLQILANSSPPDKALKSALSDATKSILRQLKSETPEQQAKDTLDFVNKTFRKSEQPCRAANPDFETLCSTLIETLAPAVSALNKKLEAPVFTPPPSAANLSFENLYQAILELDSSLNQAPHWILEVIQQILKMSTETETSKLQKPRHEQPTWPEFPRVTNNDLLNLLNVQSHEVTSALAQSLPKVIVREQLNTKNAQDVPTTFSMVSTNLPTSSLPSRESSNERFSSDGSPADSTEFHRLSPDLNTARGSTDSSWSPSETARSPLDFVKNAKDTICPIVRRAQRSSRDPRFKQNLNRRRIAPNFAQLCLSCGKGLEKLTAVDFVQCSICLRQFCLKCSCSQHNPDLNMMQPYYPRKKCCAVCVFQSTQRPECTVDEWHSKFHTSQDLRFVHELRDALPYIPGLFIEIHFSRPPCWRRKFGTRRGNFSFKFYGGIFEARLEALLRSLYLNVSATRPCS